MQNLEKKASTNISNRKIACEYHTGNGHCFLKDTYGQYFTKPEDAHFCDPSSCVIRKSIHKLGGNKSLEVRPLPNEEIVYL